MIKSEIIILSPEERIDALGISCERPTFVPFIGQEITAFERVDYHPPSEQYKLKIGDYEVSVTIGFSTFVTSITGNKNRVNPEPPSHTMFVGKTFDSIGFVPLRSDKSTLIMGIVGCCLSGQEYEPWGSSMAFNVVIQWEK